MIISGGKSVYGAQLGVLMLQSRFPRLLGDPGHAASWPLPVRYKVVRGASPGRVVRGNPEALLPDFIAAGRELIDDGCTAITTSCGFLVRFQQPLADALGVPVATSSLLQIASIQALLPSSQRVGVLTIDAEALGAEHLAYAGAAQDTPIVGTEGGREFTAAMLEDRLQLDVEAARQDLIDATHELTARGNIGAIVLECTNMAPFARDIGLIAQRPVLSIMDVAIWLQRSVESGY